MWTVLNCGSVWNGSVQFEETLRVRYGSNALRQFFDTPNLEESGESLRSSLQIDDAREKSGPQIVQTNDTALLVSAQLHPLVVRTRHQHLESARIYDKASELGRQNRRGVEVAWTRSDLAILRFLCVSYCIIHTTLWIGGIRSDVELQKFGDDDPWWIIQKVLLFFGTLKISNHAK